MAISSNFVFLGIVSALICGNNFVSASVVTTKNPALLGVSYIGPAPHYNCTANGAYPHETDCEYFYDCWNGDATLGVCTEMQLFDLRWKGCEEAENVACGDRIRPTGYPGTNTPPITEGPEPTGPTTTTTIPPINFTCPEPGGAFPHDLRCDYYWVCWENEATLHRCNTAAKYLFDLRYSGCNFAHQTQCQDRERPPEYPEYEGDPPPTEDPGNTPPPENYTCPSPGGAFPHEQFCEYYWLCQDNVPSLIKCHEDYLFDLVFMGCNFPEKTNCQDRERPPGYPTGPTDPPGTVGPTLPTPPPDNFTCPEPGGAFPHAERCEYYWLCQEDVATLTKCQLNFLFDLNYDGCNYPEQTDCQDRERPPGYPGGPTTTTPRITTTTTGGPTNGTTTTTRRPGELECPPDEEVGHYPDPDDCTAFWMCVWGTPVHFTCPSGLYYNPETKECDYPANVECGDRPIP